MQRENVPVLSILLSHWEAGAIRGLSQMDFEPLMALQRLLWPSVLQETIAPCAEVV